MAYLKTDISSADRALQQGLGPRRSRGFLVTTMLLVICFGKPLFDLMRFAAGSELYSYILLIPFISIYLVRKNRHRVAREFRPAVQLSVLAFAGGFSLLAFYWFPFGSVGLTNREDTYAVIMLSFLLLLTGLFFLFLGGRVVRSLTFPLGFLFFMVPFPNAVRDGIETFFQYTSAAAANFFFTLSGATALQSGLQFQLPGITLAVAPECSGIHSSWALLIISVLAGHLLLRSIWKRVILVIIVIPLAILRNGFRIYVIGQLCIHKGPDMIDSPIHRHGGPLFFLLSLLPFFLLLLFLVKTERRGLRAIRSSEPGNLSC